MGFGSSERDIEDSAGRLGTWRDNESPPPDGGTRGDRPPRSVRLELPLCSCDDRGASMPQGVATPGDGGRLGHASGSAVLKPGRSRVNDLNLHRRTTVQPPPPTTTTHVPGLHAREACGHEQRSGGAPAGRSGARSWRTNAYTSARGHGRLSCAGSIIENLVPRPPAPGLSTTTRPP